MRSLDGVAAAVPRPNGLLVLNPSEMTVSRNVPPPRLQGQRVVLLREDFAEVTRIPVSRPDDSRTEVEYSLRLDRRGDVFGAMQARQTGAEAGALRARLLKARPEAYEDLVSAFLGKRGAHLRASSVSVADLRVLRRPLLIQGNVDVKNLLRGDARELYVPLETLLGSQSAAPAETRRTPRLFPAPRSSEVRITLTLPEGWTPVFVPPVEPLEGPGAHMRIGARKETDRRIGLLFEERIDTLGVPPESYAAWYQHNLDRQALAARTFGVRRPEEPELEY